MTLALAGVAAGVVHVLSGPDHLAAIAPYAVTDKTRSWKTGVRWGLGHSTGVLGVGQTYLSNDVGQRVMSEKLAPQGTPVNASARGGRRVWGYGAGCREQAHHPSLAEVSQICWVSPRSALLLPLLHPKCV